MERDDFPDHGIYQYASFISSQIILFKGLGLSDIVLQ